MENTTIENSSGPSWSHEHFPGSSPMMTAIVRSKTADIIKRKIHLCVHG